MGWQLANRHVLLSAKVNSGMPGVPPVSTLHPDLLAARESMGVAETVSALHWLPVHWFHILLLLLPQHPAPLPSSLYFPVKTMCASS